MGECYYFGCLGSVGHHLWSDRGQVMFMCRGLPPDFPIRPETLDAGLLLRDRSEVEGEAVVVHLRGWTIVSFWDRSVDIRPGSNSAFIQRGTWTLAEALQCARDHFPQVMSRFKFAIHEGTTP